MAGNAHRNRHRNRPCKNSDCMFCKYRAKVGKALGRFANSTGNRHNPTRKRGGRRNPTRKVG